MQLVVSLRPVSPYVPRLARAAVVRDVVPCKATKRRNRAHRLVMQRLVGPRAAGVDTHEQQRCVARRTDRRRELEVSTPSWRPNEPVTSCIAPIAPVGDFEERMGTLGHERKLFDLNVVPSSWRRCACAISSRTDYDRAQACDGALLL